MDSTKLTLHVDLVVKFGGSAITNKRELETLDEDSLNKAAELLIDCCRQKLKCIVVHGAGSFGHHHAKEYKVNSGWTQFEGNQLKIDTVKRGFCITRESVTKLNHLVTGCLLSKTVPAVGVPACGNWETNDGTVVKYSLDSVKNLIQNGFVPVLHGDCVLDHVKGCAILSGDTIIQKCSEVFTVNRVVFLTSVRGVYSSPPDNNTEAHLIGTVSVNKAQQNMEKQGLKEGGKVIMDASPGSLGSNSGAEILMKNQCTDVTGGMTLKFKTANEIVRDSEGKTKVFICMIGSRFANDVCLYGVKKADDMNDSGTEFLYVT